MDCVTPIRDGRKVKAYVVKTPHGEFTVRKNPAVPGTWVIDNPPKPSMGGTFTHFGNAVNLCLMYKPTEGM